MVSEAEISNYEHQLQILPIYRASLPPVMAVLVYVQRYITTHL